MADTMIHLYQILKSSEQYTVLDPHTDTDIEISLSEDIKEQDQDHEY